MTIKLRIYCSNTWGSAKKSPTGKAPPKPQTRTSYDDRNSWDSSWDSWDSMAQLQLDFWFQSFICTYMPSVGVFLG